MNGHGEKQSRKQEQAITALLTEPTVAEAARTAGVSESTVRRWLHDSKFRNAYRAARGELLEHTLARLIQASEKAIAKLEVNLDCGKPSIEVRAAAVILRELIRARELVDLGELIQEQEGRLAAVENATTGGDSTPAARVYIPRNKRSGAKE